MSEAARGEDDGAQQRNEARSRSNCDSPGNWAPDVRPRISTRGVLYPEGPVTRAARTAIALAKQRGAPEITPDDLLAGLLLTASRFGIVWVGDKAIDLMTLGLEPADSPATAKTKAAYSPVTADIFDRAALIAKADGGCRVELVHMLAAYSSETGGLMGEVKTRFGFDDGSWRAALTRFPRSEEPSVNLVNSRLASEPGREVKEFFTPEEAAAFLGLHIQTVRGYVRSGKLPALRVAGERAIRIRRQELLGLLEPLEPGASEEDNLNQGNRKA